MSALTSPVTGAPTTGFTTPAYTFIPDVPPNSYSKQWAVTGFTGTQVGVDTAGSSVARPWTFTASRPQSLKTLAVVDPVTGQLRAVPMNDFTYLTRKGVTPLAGQASKTSLMRTVHSVPAGSDTADAPNVRAGVAFHVGCLWQASDKVGDLPITGVIAL